MGVQYDVDQLRVIQAQERVVVADAKAGAGKTTTAIGFSEARVGKKILYICLNKANQMEAQQRFPSYVTCRTTHALAYATVGKRFGPRVINSWKAKHVADMLNVPLKTASPIHSALLSFFGNSHSNVTAADFENAVDRYSLSKEQVHQLVPMANKLWERMCDPKDEKVTITHDTYLKIWALNKPQLPYDVVILDEAQDTNPVTFDVVASQERAQLLIIGDKHQSIYGFRGSVNAMEKFAAMDGCGVYNMPRTWRFGERTAALANMLLSIFKGEETPIIGMGKDEPYKVGSPMAYLSRSNMELFDKAAQRKGKGMHWVGGCENYRMELVMDAFHLFSGHPEKVKDQIIKSFDNWVEFAKAVEETQDVEFKILHKIVDNYRYGIPDLIKDIRSNEVLDPTKADRILTTAHKSKGLDWDYVKIGDDFQVVSEAMAEFREKGKLSPTTLQEVNLLYVAFTRAKLRVFLNEDSKELLQIHNASTKDGQNAIGDVEFTLVEEAADFAKAVVEIGDEEMALDFVTSFGVPAKDFLAMTEGERMVCVAAVQESLLKSIETSPVQTEQPKKDAVSHELSTLEM